MTEITSFAELGRQMDDLAAQNEKLERQAEDLAFRLEESLAHKILSMEDIGWSPVWGANEDIRGPRLRDLHGLAEKLRPMASDNPLHKRGAQLRHAYVFGRGMEFSGTTEKTKKSIKDLYNQAALFSVKAHERNNLELFTTGNFFVLRNETTNICTVVPIEDIKGEFTDPDDPSQVWYFLRTWTREVDGKSQEMKRWYPVSRYKKSQIGRGRRGKIRQYITTGNERVAVDQGAVIYHHTTQQQAGWAYGVPDSLAAMIWSLSYSEYLQDNAKLVKALQKIAWAVTSATPRGASSAAVQIAQPGVGGTANMASGNVLSGVGVPSAQVNMNNGQPLAAMVATSFGVPVIALLSSPGATGGSYGAATTLDMPTIKGMKAVQDSWKLLYEEILNDMGSPDALVSFPALEQDPTYREVQSIVTAKEAGLLHQDEAREGVIQVLDVTKLHDDPPEDNPEFQVARQGRTGSVPGGINQDSTDSQQNGEQSEQ